MFSPWVLILFGFALSVVAAISARGAREQYGWPRTKGSVSVSTVAMGRGFHPDVQYWFVYEGRRYYGLQVFSYMMTRPTSGWSRRITRKYPAGASVDVYVNPRDPQKSVLEPGGDAAYLWLMGGISFAFIAGGILMLLR